MYQESSVRSWNAIIFNDNRVVFDGKAAGRHHIAVQCIIGSRFNGNGGLRSFIAKGSPMPGWRAFG